MESLCSHDSSHKYKRLTRVDFSFFLKHFFFKYCFWQYFFCFVIYEVIPILCLGSYVWFVHLGWPGSLKDYIYMCVCVWEREREREIYIYIYQQLSISYIFLCVRPFLIFFLWLGLFSYFCLYLSLKHEFFTMSLSFIYLNKKI